MNVRAVIIYLLLSVFVNTFVFSNDDVQLNPNPATDYFDVILNTSTADNTSISVYNVLGVSLTTYTTTVLDSNTIRVSFPSFREGMYVVIISMPNGVITKRLVVDKS